MKGLYIHIPFCKAKCGYCDFYSFTPTENQKDSYLSAVLSYIEKQGKSSALEFDSVYFGGGTPSFFGGKRISRILQKARDCFEIAPNAEITVECNPSSVDEELVFELAKAGVNRISMGVQSAVDSERKLLGRLSKKEQADCAIELFKKRGITNISLDLMLGIPEQTKESLDESIDFILSKNVCHVSAYILKLEEGTPLFNSKNTLSLPDDDEVCELYLHTVKRLSEKGFLQYEISNFAKPGFDSRHNLHYWNCDEYLGIGPSAHSFVDGKRFFFERDFSGFINGAEPVFDCLGGDGEEYIMLRLRLAEGLSDREYFNRFKKHLPPALFEKAKEFEKHSLTEVSESSVRLTAKGFLVSNSIISELINLL